VYLVVIYIYMDAQQGNQENNVEPSVRNQE